MSSKADVRDPRADTVKWLLAVAVLGGGIAGFYYYSEQLLVWRVLALLVSAGIAALIAYQTELGQRAWDLVQGSRAEVRRVVWPTRQETLQTTLAVLALVLVTGIFLWLLDMFLGWAVRQMTGIGG